MAWGNDNKPAWKDVIQQEGVDDMCLLSKVTNEQIATNLKQRYEKDIIYTYIGNVLISVNPFKMLPIYEDPILFSYINKPRIELPPHVYATAEESYRALVNEKENQCVIISGESGAGKTEAAKKVMHYIASVSGSGSGQIEHVKNVILGSNPLLEAFGNAKTLRNNNSSRFGKYFEITFNENGDPDGGVITNYLLEKSRVVYQIRGERNFHIFYQLTKAASNEQKTRYQILDPGSYNYLNMGKTLNVDTIDDFAEWNDTLESMNIVGISEAEKDNILSLLSGILWLGNIDFNESGDKVSIKDMKPLDTAAALLQVPSSFLKNALEERTMETKKGRRRGTTYKVPLNYVQAIAGRDAISKIIYDRIFDFLVMKVNAALAQGSNSKSCIGVLDIYGFEVFDVNSFEQLCINYVNEKLQQIFIEFVLKQEQEEYVEEGIDWQPIDFFNNKIVCDLLEEVRPPGIFSIMNDVCASVHSQGEAADRALGDRLQGCSSNRHFQGRGNKAFTIKHYAGDVTYELVGVVEKNKDVFVNDHLQIIKLTENSLLQYLFPEETSDGGGRRPKTAAMRLKSSCTELVEKLSLCTPHYIRCIKPNDSKQADHYDSKRVEHQIQYLGLLDNVKVKRAGFAYRTTFNKFFERYFLISPSTAYAAKKIWNGNDLDGCVAILKDQPVSPQEWQTGRTKVFIKSPETLFLLENLRVNYWHNMVNRIKFSFRTWKDFKHVCSTRIKNSFRTWIRYREQCVIIIQKGYRDYKDVLPPTLRFETEPMLQNKKKRRRLSMVSVRRYYGDYLDIKRNTLVMGAMAGGSNEQVLFSQKGSVIVHPGFMKKRKLSPRTFVLTENALYIIMYSKDKGQIQAKLDRRIAANMITGITFSPLGDDIIILHVESEYDTVIKCLFKSELLAWVMATNPPLVGPIEFLEKVKYMKKKKNSMKLQFIESTEPLHVNGFLKSGKYFCPPRLPSSSTPAVLSRKTGDIAMFQGGANPVRSGGPPAGGPGRAMPTPGGPGRALPTPGGASSGGPPGRALPTPGGGPPGRSLPTPAAPTKPTCEALYNYEAREADELTISKGDIITIIKENPDWWEGELNGKVGLFPANYVKKL
eukprot:TRINITY_DN12207_c0_g1_i1.p1 TRINITY_DN12207_c0_g1~~TRINITY_DN12207_c0_g1_i1.p1  ORF type:complete len:1112 (-),score=281.88 TRINITY_DN12207_c0_g1_i1:48-3341(-)